MNVSLEATLPLTNRTAGRISELPLFPRKIFGTLSFLFSLTLHFSNTLLNPPKKASKDEIS
jgi:hypothetical protein